MTDEERSQSNKNLLSPPQPGPPSIYQQKPSRQTGGGLRYQEKKGQATNYWKIPETEREGQKEHKRKGENEVSGEMLAQ